MKQIFILLLLILSTLQSDMVEAYIDKELSYQEKLNLNENNATLLNKHVDIESGQFALFYLEYVNSLSSGKVSSQSPFRAEIFKLERRMNTNKGLDNNYAVYRDELKIASLQLRANIRETLFKTVAAAEGSDYQTFERELEKIIVDRHAKEPNISLDRYTFVRKLKTYDPITKRIAENLHEYIAMQDIHNDVSAILIENSHKIYKIVVLSGFGVLTLSMHIEESALAQSLAPYLEPIHLNSSKLIYIAIIIILIFLTRFSISFVVRKIFKWISGTEDDAQYILSMTSRPFTILLSVVGLELVFIVYSGLSDVEWVFTLFEIIYVLASVFLFYRVGNAIAVVKMDEMSQNKAVRNEVVNLGLKMMNVMLAIISVMLILKLLGFNLTALLSGLGLGGVAVAFAAKDTIANFFGSISILLSDMFEQGDWIAVDNMEGHVVEIGLRATTVRTFDNALIAIPNFKLADSGIKNWSRRKMGRRIKMVIGVTYESDMDDIKNALEQMRIMLHEHPLLMGEKTEYMSNERQMKLVSKEDLKGIKRQIMVNLDAFDSSSINIMVYCFSRSVIWNEWFVAKEDVMFKIADILKDNNLEFAYPTLMLHQAQETLESQDKDVSREVL